MFHHRPAYSAPPGQNTVYRPRARFPSSQQASVNSCGNTLQHYGNPLGQYSPRPSSPLSKQQQQSVVEKVKILVNENRSSLDNTDCPSGHLLQDTWTFWYLRLQDNFSWEKSQLPIGSCSSVEQFWSIYDQIVSLAEAPSGCNYSLFKKGIRPVWEDPMNQHGGRLVFTIKKDKLDYKLFVEKMWFEFSMAVVGNVLPDVSEQICGICGANRNQMVKIAIWTRERKKHEEIRQIGKQSSIQF